MSNTTLDFGGVSTVDACAVTPQSPCPSPSLGCLSCHSRLLELLIKMCPALGTLDTTLRVVPPMEYESSSGTPTESHCSFWTTSSWSISTSQTSTIDSTSSKGFTESTFDQAEDFDLHNLSMLRNAPDQLHAQPATRPTAVINSSDTVCDICVLAQDPCSVNSECCLTIIRALKDPLVDIQASDTCSYPTIKSHRLFRLSTTLRMPSTIS